MINTIIYVFILAAMLYMAVLYASEALILLAFCGLIFMVVAYAYLFYQYRNITAEIGIPIATAETRQRIPAEIHLSNKGRCSALKVHCKVSWKHAWQKKETAHSFWGNAKAKQETILPVACEVSAAGSYRIALKAIRIYDGLGFFYIKKRVKQETELCVLPEPVQLNVTVGQASRHFIGESDVYDENQGGDDPSEVFQIREFRAGDKIQSIHWKLSAKADEWMVKENSQPLGCPVVLFADMTKTEPETADMFLRVLYSISLVLVEQKCAHYLVWDCGKGFGIRRIRVEKEEQVYQFLLTFFATDFAEQEKKAVTPLRKRYREKKAVTSLRERYREKEAVTPLRERYREKYKAQPYITDVRINTALQVFVNDVQVAEIAQKHFEEECEQLELMV